jgi:hypothetical protein
MIAYLRYVYSDPTQAAFWANLLSAIFNLALVSAIFWVI